MGKTRRIIRERRKRRMKMKGKGEAEKKKEDAQKRIKKISGSYKVTERTIKRKDLWVT